MNAPGKPAATALIADDEPHLAKHLANRLAALWPELDIIDTAANGLEALERIQALQPDIAFLDIRMPGLTGLEVASRLSVPCRLVFVTAYDQYAIEAFEREAVDYLLKPISDERLVKTIERLRTSLASTPSAPPEALLAQLRSLLATAPAAEKPAPLKWVKAQVGQAVRLVAVDDICYFQATDKYTAVYTRDAELLIRTTIRELVEQLDPEVFWQIHRGTVVNAKQIASARNDTLGRVSLLLKDRP
ncbi:MAG TPA: LytTR family DNA-binding domain-containing protein [Rhodocyclaceae bacterium]|nr:LytTR family DNA-binding domain-containing protein [Rhodocyclaceae bacterium]